MISPLAARRKSGSGNSTWNCLFAQQSLSSSISDQFPNRFRSHRHIHMLHSIRRQRVDDRVYDRRSCADRSGFADSFHAEWIYRRRRLRAIGFEPRDLRSLWQRVIHQLAGHELSLFVVNDFLIQRLSDRLHDAAVHLAINQQRVNYLATIIDGNVANDLGFTGFLIDLDDADMSAE